MKTLYFDCFNGISGDMTVGALLDAGVDRDLFAERLASLNLEGYTYEITTAVKSGIAATDFNVMVTEQEHNHRNLADILYIINGSVLNENVKAMAAAVFERLADAEARVHGTTPDKVHFHEVGAVDSIVDIVSACICIDILAPDKIYCSALCDGSGTATSGHGEMPIPVPAVTELLRGVGARIKQKDCNCELITPTGAALAAALVNEFAPMSDMSISAVGYGAGKRDMQSPNVLRVFLGEVAEEEKTAEEVIVMETNIDDCTGEILAYTAERLFGAGALDVYFVSVFMKKGRPAYKLSVLCNEADIGTMRDIIFAETSSIGVRYFRAYRECMQREITRLSTEYGIAEVKTARSGEIVKSYPEFESAKELAINSGAPLRKVYDDIAKKNEGKW